MGKGILYKVLPRSLNFYFSPLLKSFKTTQYLRNVPTHSSISMIYKVPLLKGLAAKHQTTSFLFLLSQEP